MPVGVPIALSGSVGGAGIALDDAGVPGKVIHQVTSKPGGTWHDLVRDLNVFGAEREAILFWWAVQGPGVPVPTSRSEMQKVYIPPRLTVNLSAANFRLYQPALILAEGYTLHMSSDGDLVLYGWAESWRESDDD